jgi:hypothetical protein
MGEYDSKTIDFDAFKTYIAKKNQNTSICTGLKLK